MNISLDTSLLLTSAIGTNGLNKSELESAQYSVQLKEIGLKLKQREYGFISILSQTEILDSCQQLFDKYSQWAKHLVVLGIGGSDLGGRMLQQALESDNPPMQVHFAGDTTDPEEYYQLLRHLDPETTVVNVISKSGGTTETAVSYIYFKKLMQDKFGDDWTKHFIFTTDIKEGSLRLEAAQSGIDTLSVPDDVGGRFSVLSAVGLFPALCMGIDVFSLLKGAQNMTAELAGADPVNNISWQIALTQYLFQKDKGVNTVVIMPYVWKMELFANWFRQLWAESSGKDGKGILPIKAVGPADQHSQVQFYTQGLWLSTFLFITASNYSHDVVLSCPDNSELTYLDNTPMGKIIRDESEATRYGLAAAGRPSVLLEIEQLDAEHIGALIILFEVAIVYLTALIGVNTFDQPGVESGKHYMFGLLGKNGFENKAKEIEDKKAQIGKNKISYTA